MANSPISALTDSQRRVLLAKLLHQHLQSESQFPMSAGQQGLWHAFRRNPESTAFNVFLPTRIRGSLRLDSLEQSLREIARRHAALRTTFSDAGGQLSQIVHDDLRPEFSTDSMWNAPDDQIRAYLCAEVERPFDLERGPLLRVKLAQIGPADWVILATTHHIIVDFWSLIIILSELREIYPQITAGERLQMPPAADNYREFVTEQERFLSGAEGERMAGYWQSVLQGVSPVLDFPTDRLRPAAFSHRADCTPIWIHPGCWLRITQMASDLRSTPFAVVHSALQVLLSRYSRQESFFIGSPFSGRSNLKYERTVGFFINMLPVKASVHGETSFKDLIQRTTAQLVDTLEHENLPIAEIVRRANIPRDPSRSPLFQVSCTFERSQRREELGRAGFLFPDQSQVFDFAGLKQESFYIPHPTCHYDLEFVFEQSENGLGAMLIYCSDLFDQQSMRQLSANFSSLFESLLSNPQLPLAEVSWAVNSPASVTGQSLSKVTVAGSNDFQDSVDSLIASSVKNNPDGVALRWPSGSMTYRELFQQASILSEQLASLKIDADQPVPVACRQGYHAFAAMLAVHWAGGAPVPVDMANPSTDIERIVRETASRCVLSDCISELPDIAAGCQLLDAQFDFPRIRRAGEPAGALRPTDARQLAYIIYTSGSTGMPKGVMVEHASICNTLRWRNKNLALGTDDRVLMLLSHQFDAALGIGWSCLSQGATLVWPDEPATRDPTLLLEQIQRERITVLPVVPSLLKVLVQQSQFAKCRSLHSIWTGGEALPVELPSLIRSKLPVRMWNLYGPTETAVETSAADVTHHPPTTKMTIGWPIDHQEILVLDELGLPVPCGVPGELGIAGPGLARGYLGDNELTASRFVQHPLRPESRLYRSGDVGRQLPDGQFEFLGRIDHQVKLRGFRVELGEIESVLSHHPFVAQAAAVLQGADSASAHLVAYVTTTRPIEPELLQDFIRTRLASYKLPARIVVLSEMPITSSGKVDRQRLPVPNATHTSQALQTPPRNSLEDLLAQVWRKELGVESVGIHQNFFEIGGSSLQAALVTTQLSAELGVHVPTALLFDLADIAQIAGRLALLYPNLIEQRFGRDCAEFYYRSKASLFSGRLHPVLAPLKPEGTKPPLILVHPPGGIVLCYRELAEFLPADQPLWAIRSRGLHGQERLPESLSEMAVDYLAALTSIQPHGPYLLGGWSLGGLVAYEMAQQLIASGESVGRLVFLDTSIPQGATHCVPEEEQVNVGLEYGIEWTLQELGNLPPEQQLSLLYEHAARLGILTEQSPPMVVKQVLQDLQALFHHHVNLALQYRLNPLAANLLLLRPTETPFSLKVAQDRGWGHLVSEVQVRFVPGHHHSMIQSPHVVHLAKVIAEELI